MENASKALIIAASVLVAILIVSMGIMIFNKAQSAGSTTDLDATEITMFNSKFERYANNQSGSQVKSLISYAISNANTNKDDPIKIPSVGLSHRKENEQWPTGDNASGPLISGTLSSSWNLNAYIGNLGKIRGAIISTHTYNIKLTYANSGLISVININWE